MDLLDPTPWLKVALRQLQRTRAVARFTLEHPDFPNDKVTGPALIEWLEKRFKAHQKNPRSYKHCHKRALHLVNRARTWRDLVKIYVPHPATVVLLRRDASFRLDRRVAEAIIQRRNQLPRRQARRLEELAQSPRRGRFPTVPGIRRRPAFPGIRPTLPGFRPAISEAVLRDLIYSACRKPGADREDKPEPSEPTVTRPQRAVGVLLPVRLETRFARPRRRGDPWTLQVRVIPNDIWLDRHDPTLTQQEIDALEIYWSARRALGGSTRRGDRDNALRAAFMALAEQVGGARAAWLIRTITDKNLPNAKANRQQERVSSLGGLPDRIEIWMGRGGNAPQRMAVLRVDHAGLSSLELPNIAKGQARWYTSFAEATKVGLATTLELDADQPDDIDVLYALGLGNSDPKELFDAHAAVGQLAGLPLGTPTNTIQGEPAARLGASAEEWFELSSRGKASSPAQRLSNAILGDAGALPPVPGFDSSVDDVDGSLVQALWHVLWGHHLKDIWGRGADMHDLGLWACDALRPEGTIPAVRVGTQPYGVLPMTSLSAWEPATGDPAIERTLHAWIADLLPTWAAVAEAAGTVEGADADGLLDRIAHTASSPEYWWRAMLPVELLWLLVLLLGGDMDLDEMVSAWDAHAEELLERATPERKYGGLLWPVRLRLPLVEPDNLPEDKEWSDVVRAIIEASPTDLAAGNLERWAASIGGALPNSLLARLLAHARVVAEAEVGRDKQGNAGPVLEPLLSLDEISRLQKDVEAAAGATNPGQPAVQLRARLIAALKRIERTDVTSLERALRACLDTASYRIDPWVTAFAWRRLQALQGTPRRLGLYGWVDAPRPGGPGPGPGGLLHAPSEAQAAAAIVLRDRAIHDEEPDRWDIQLDSGLVRGAARLADRVRAGDHLHEWLGREVERIIQDPGIIGLLRLGFPLRTEHEGTRPCDGVAVLRALFERPASLPGISAEANAALRELAATVDAYGDLLVAESVYHVVQRRGEAAQAAMEAAAGLSAPPNLEVIQTPRTGHTVATTVLSALAARDLPDPSVAHPVDIAEPALAGFLTQVTGAASSAAWTWRIRRDDDTTVDVTLTSLGLTVSDAIALGQNALHALCAAHGQGTLAPAEPDGAVIQAGDRSLDTAQRWVSALGARPVDAAALGITGADADAFNASVQQQLVDRSSQLRAKCETTVANLEAAVGQSDAVRGAAMAAALQWGAHTRPDASLDLDAQLGAAAAALQARLQAVPADVSALSLGDLARQLAELAVPDGRIPILPVVDLAGTALQAVPRNSGLSTFDTEWLPVVSAVRDALARLEALQLEGFAATGQAPLHQWSNRPGDPWQTDKSVDADTGRRRDSRLTVLLGPTGVHDPGNPGRVAMALVDQWSEMVPDTDHATTVAFDFEAPGARAPQAIVLAVPHDNDSILESDDLLRIVADTRALARARMVEPRDLSPWALGLPTLMLPSHVPSGADLDRHDDEED